MGILINFSVHSFILLIFSLLTMRAAFVAGALAAGTNAFPFFNQPRDVVTKYETATAELEKAQDTCKAGTVTVTNGGANTVTVTREETKNIHCSGSCFAIDLRRKGRSYRRRRG